MHTEWRRIETYTLDTNKPFRYVTDYPGGELPQGTRLEQYYEQQVEVRDVNDEPTEDGLYKDREDERWIRLNGKWLHQDDDFWGWQKWDGADDMSKYAPFALVDISEYSVV